MAASKESQHSLGASARKILRRKKCPILTIFGTLDWRIISLVKPTPKQVIAIRCPTCGAAPGQKCELSTGLPRFEPHQARRLAAGDEEVLDANIGENG